MHTFAGLQQEEYTQLIETTLEGKDFSKLPLTPVSYTHLTLPTIYSV